MHIPKVKQTFNGLEEVFNKSSSISSFKRILESLHDSIFDEFMKSMQGDKESMRNFSINNIESYFEKIEGIDKLKLKSDFVL